MCDFTTLQKILKTKKYFYKKIYHTRMYIILHLTIDCNSFLKKSGDNFLFFISKNFLKTKLKLKKYFIKSFLKIIFIFIKKSKQIVPPEGRAQVCRDEPACSRVHEGGQAMRKFLVRNYPVPMEELFIFIF